MHAITQRDSGLNEIAYVGEVPWHGLGQSLDKGASIDQWEQAAGFNWRVQRSIVRYCADRANPNAAPHQFPEQHVLFRSDDKKPLGIVSQRYKVVQPREVLEFFRDVTEVTGGHLETAGTLFGGKRFWALANLGNTESIRGDDTVTQYLLLTTSCDGSLATEARETVIRAVCHNTVSAALSVKTKHAIKVSHRSVFDADEVKRELAETQGHYYTFVKAARELSRISVNNAAAEKFIATLLASSTTREDVAESSAFKSILGLFKGSALGGTLLGAEGSAWGLVNAVTEHVDHRAQARTADGKLNSAWFGNGDSLKTRAVELALSL